MLVLHTEQQQVNLHQLGLLTTNTILSTSTNCIKLWHPSRQMNGWNEWMSPKILNCIPVYIAKTI